MSFFRLHLRRVTSGGRWIPEIDGLRFVAIASVVLFHIFRELTASHFMRLPVQPRYADLAWLLGNGDRGVRLFFVISGLILCRPFRDQYLYGGKRVSLRYYFLRRITRLEPPNILALLLWTATIVAYFHTPMLTLMEHLAASMFYVHSLLYHQGSTINFVTWSLEVEIQFYVLAPLIALIFLIPNPWLRRGMLLAGILVPGLLQRHASAYVQLTILYYFQYFLAGYLLCDLLPRNFEDVRRSFVWDGMALAAWILLFAMRSGWVTQTILPVLILVAYTGAFYGSVGNWVFRRNWIAIIGGMCYSIYLTHFWVITLCVRLTRHLNRFGDFLANYLLQVVSLGGLILLFGACFFVFVERPCMDPRWPNRLLEMWRALRAGAPSSSTAVETE
jgi:peptidoglycan/LPS O-acetylase OafA/YrhL